MIALIRVFLTHGNFSSRKELRNFVANIYKNVPGQPLPRLSGRLYRHLSAVLAKSVYVCIPAAGATASFLWINSKHFLIIIETYYQGDLKESAEIVLHTIIRELRKNEIEGTYDIKLQSLQDARAYIIGARNSLGKRLWEALKDNVVFFFIGVLGSIIAYIWLDDYFTESLAGLVQLTLISLWEFIVVLVSFLKKPIYWSINEQ